MTATFQSKYKLAVSCFFIFMTALFVITMTDAAPASSPHEITKSYDWYFKPTKDHTQPAMIPEAAGFIDNYGVMYLGNPGEKAIYLTFDAGFDNGYHTPILDTLKKHHVPAAFFVDGNFVKTKPDLVNRIIDEGHILGNHSLNHPDITKKTDFEEYKKQLLGWEELVDKATNGKEIPKFFRPPMGKFSELSLSNDQKLGYKTVFWSLAYADWDQNKQPDPEYAKRLLKDRMHNGCILLLHSTSKTNAMILDDLITELLAAGYRFESLTTLANSSV